MNRTSITWLVILALCLGLLTGCTGKNAEQDLTVPVDIDPTVSFPKHGMDDVVMTIDGSEVTWSEFFYRLYSVVYQIKYYSDEGKMVWSDPCIADSSMTNAEYAWKTAVDVCTQYHVLENHFNDLGIRLEEDDETALNEQLWSDIESFCGADGTEEDFNKVLEDLYLDRATYDFINRVAILYDKAYETVYGVHGEQLTDAQIEQFITDNEYITAKHILIKTVDDANQALTGDELAEKTARATLLLSQLQEAEGDARLALFDELMVRYSEDTGLMAYPQGYTFTPGEMVEEFQSGAEALGDYEMSGLVQSQFGYHIILRLPTTRDSVVDYVDGENDNTIGAYAAAEAFGKQVEEWTQAAGVVWTKEFENETAASIFALPADYVAPTPTPTPEAE